MRLETLRRLVEPAGRTGRSRERDLEQIQPLVEPTTNVDVRIVGIVGDQIRSRVFAPVTAALVNVIRLLVDADGDAERVQLPAIFSVDEHPFGLVVADGELRDDESRIAGDESAVIARPRRHATAQTRAKQRIRLSDLFERPQAGKRTLHGRGHFQDENFVFPVGVVAETRPRIHFEERIAFGQIVVDVRHERFRLVVAKNILMSRFEIEGDEIGEALARRDGFDEELLANDLLTDVERFSEPASVVDTGDLVDVRAVDDHLRLDVRRVDPLAGEILREETRRMRHLGHDGDDDQLLRPVRRRVETRTLGEQRLAEPTRLILSRQHAAELVLPSLRPDAFLGDAGENVALVVRPTAETLVQRMGVDRRNQLTAPDGRSDCRRCRCRPPETRR